MWCSASVLLLLVASLQGHRRGNISDPGGDDKEPRNLRLQDLGGEDKDQDDLHLQDLGGDEFPHSIDDEDPAQVSCGALQEFRNSLDRDRAGDSRAVIPVLLFSCDRVSVSRALDLLISYRPSKDSSPSSSPRTAPTRKPGGSADEAA